MARNLYLVVWAENPTLVEWERNKADALRLARLSEDPGGCNVFVIHVDNTAQTARVIHGFQGRPKAERLVTEKNPTNPSRSAWELVNSLADPEEPGEYFESELDLNELLRRLFVGWRR